MTNAASIIQSAGQSQPVGVPSHARIEARRRCSVDDGFCAKIIANKFYLRGSS
jgi:hypothetical protein